MSSTKNVCVCGCVAVCVFVCLYVLEFVDFFCSINFRSFSARYARKCVYQLAIPGLFSVIK